MRGQRATKLEKKVAWRYLVREDQEEECERGKKAEEGMNRKEKAHMG